LEPEIEQRDWLSRILGKHPSLTIASIAVAGVVLVLALARPNHHALELKCYFKDAQGLRAGAKVRVAGVEVGTVNSVRVRPESRDNPVEVNMMVQTPYELKIPNDAVVVLESAGVLGETFPQIDIQGASGPPVGNGGVLKTAPTVNVSSQELVERLSNALAQKSCDPGKRAPEPSSSPHASQERR
jgi:ABC-type transporter Mla subunit MlaD